jgi:hypothetical protein
MERRGSLRRVVAASVVGTSLVEEERAVAGRRFVRERASERSFTP